MAAERTVAEIKLDGCPEGLVLRPLEPKGEIYEKFFSGWETPLAPWGGFSLDSGLAVVQDEGGPVLEWTFKDQERALVKGSSDWRDYRVVASVKPIDAEAPPNTDRADRREALTGIVFRIHTSRHYYHFGIEGRRRAVLYRRSDDEWFVLSEQPVELPPGYVTLQVALDGDGIRCLCEELGVEFFNTDTMFKAGKAGVRGIGRARVASVRITMNSAQEKKTERRRRLRETDEGMRSRRIPDPVLIRTLDLKEFGGRLQFIDFASPDRYDMLIAGDKLRALTSEGEKLWEIPETVNGIVGSAEHTGSGRLLYGFVGSRGTESRRNVTGGDMTTVVADEMCVVQGATGEILARRKLPALDDVVYITAFSLTSANFAGSGPFDIVLREWRSDMGGGGINLWVYDRELNPLWKARVDVPYGHAHALQFHDVNGDGRDEFLAGGTLFSSEGHVIWRHDLGHEMAEISGAHHYDAAAIGNFSGDPTTDPVAFLLGGSAGVYVLDGRTGRTRMIHRIGHAQGKNMVKVRSDIPGVQVLVACRWGNMGILNLFSGNGDRLWTIQPDYIGQGALPVGWGRRREQLIWTNTSREAMAFYDGYGQRVKTLTEIQRMVGDHMRREIGAGVVRLGSEPSDLLGVTVEGRLYLFSSEEN